MRVGNISCIYCSGLRVFLLHFCFWQDEIYLINNTRQHGIGAFRFLVCRVFWFYSRWFFLWFCIPYVSTSGFPLFLLFPSLRFSLRRCHNLISIHTYHIFLKRPYDQEPKSNILLYKYCLIKAKSEKRKADNKQIGQIGQIGYILLRVQCACIVQVQLTHRKFGPRYKEPIRSRGEYLPRTSRSRPQGWSFRRKHPFLSRQ